MRVQLVVQATASNWCMLLAVELCRERPFEMEALRQQGGWFLIHPQA